jgi:secondary thiamine-phosphate synthase enzyme
MITLNVTTHKHEEFLDITDQIRTVVREHDWQTGLLMVFCPHTTAAITINENADPDVQSDIISTLARLIPLKGAYEHSEGNSDAHVKSSLVGANELIIVRSGELALGTWQGIFFCEFDGPRRRQVYVEFTSGQHVRVTAD